VSQEHKAGISSQNGIPAVKVVERYFTPSYTELTQEAEKLPYPEYLARLHIQSLDTPQWEWSNAQCREWLCAVLLYCGRDSQHALKKSRRFHGSGVNMFCMDISRSALLLSSEKHMTTTYWFMEKAYKSGTVPEGYILNNFPKLKDK
jgi:hypothetical protein